MRGTKAKRLRRENPNYPHPGRLGGGNVTSSGVKGERPKWRSREDRLANRSEMMKTLGRLFRRHG